MRPLLTPRVGRLLFLPAEVGVPAASRNSTGTCWPRRGRSASLLPPNGSHSLQGGWGDGLLFPFYNGESPHSPKKPPLSDVRGQLASVRRGGGKGSHMVPSLTSKEGDPLQPRADEAPPLLGVRTPPQQESRGATGSGGELSPPCLLASPVCRFFSSHVGIREAKREARELTAMLLLGPGGTGQSAAGSLRQEWKQAVHALQE